MAPAMATTRLRKELQKLMKDPPPGIIAEPNEKDILTWYYAIEGPKDTPFENGVYVGKLKFPSEYPMKAPSISMMTPSGRFQINTKICMSMSDFHPESWNPMWSVSTIIQGIQSFMASSELTTGGMRAPASEQKKLAAGSIEYNKKTFPNLFDGDIEAAFVRAEEARKVAGQAAARSQARTNKSSSSSRTSSSRTSSSRQSNNKTRGGGNDDKEEKGKKGEKEDPKPAAELTPEEIEKRRKKNAKKRAKQKAKKAEAAAANHDTNDSDQQN